MLVPGYFTRPYSPLGRPAVHRPRRGAVAPAVGTRPGPDPEVAAGHSPQTRRVPVRAEGEPESLASRPPVDTVLPTSVEPDEPPAALTAPEDGQHDAEQRLHDAARELEAARWRVERDARRAKEETQAQLVAKLLPLVDSLDRAVAAEPEQNALSEGIVLVRAQLEQILAEYGLERIESVGQPFDPTLHEAVDVVRVDRESEDGTVVREWDAGYRFGGRVLRAAKVTVGKLR